MTLFGGIIIVNSILIVIGGIVMISTSESHDMVGIIGGIGIVLIGGLLLLTIFIALPAISAQKTDIQQAAEKQGITVNYDDGITTNTPCKINLELQNGELVMRGTNSVVTHDKLETICTTLAK